MAEDHTVLRLRLILAEWYSAVLCVKGNLKLTAVLTPKAEVRSPRSLLLTQLRSGCQTTAESKATCGLTGAVESKVIHGTSS